MTSLETNLESLINSDMKSIKSVKPLNKTDSRNSLLNKSTRTLNKPPLPRLSLSRNSYKKSRSTSISRTQSQAVKEIQADSTDKTVSIVASAAEANVEASEVSDPKIHKSESISNIQRILNQLNMHLKKKYKLNMDKNGDISLI